MEISQELSNQRTRGTKRQVPTLSLRDYTHGSPAQKEKFTAELFSGIKDYGFIVLKDHPIDATLLDQSYKILQKFYELPAEVKKAYISSAGGGQRGYTPFGTEHAKDSPVMDLKEFWHVGRDIDDQKRSQFFLSTKYLAR